MSHRILLVADDPPALAPLEASLRRQGQSVIVASDARQATVLARQFLPSVVVVSAALAEPPGRDWLAVLALHPATAALPVVVVTRPPPSEAAVLAFGAGVSEIVHAPLRPEELGGRLDQLLGSAHDATRRAAAIDRRGPAVLRRVGSYLQRSNDSGTLEVDAAGDEATLPFDDGRLGEVRYGDLRGDGALQALLSHPGDAPWSLRFVPQGPRKRDTRPLPDDFSVDVVDEGEGLALEDVDVAALPSGVSARLLLVDDDPALLELYGRFLTRAGYDVLTAPNGKLGFETAVHARPDVILSDIMMPESDGWAFLTEVRDDLRLRETPFLLLSCHHDFVEKLRELEAGADDYLEKGLRGDAVVARVTAAFLPRRRLLDELDVREGFRGSLGQLGVQRLLTKLGDEGATGTLLIDDGVVLYSIGHYEGRLVSSSATAHERREDGKDVLLSLLTLDDAPFYFVPDDVPKDREGARFGDMREALCLELNAARDRTRERMLGDDAKLGFDAERLRFYRLVCPAVVRSILAELVRGASPREVMASGLASPVLVEWVVKDLLQKQVASFG